MDNLYIIGTLKPGKTLSLNPITVINHNFTKCLYRWYHDENRHKVLDEIKKIIDETSFIFSLLSNDLDSRKRLLLALYSAREGVETLNITYKEDSSIISRIKSLSDDIHILKLKYQLNIIPTWRKYNTHIAEID